MLFWFSFFTASLIKLFDFWECWRGGNWILSLHWHFVENGSRWRDTGREEKQVTWSAEEDHCTWTWTWTKVYIQHLHSGQTHYVRPVPAKTVAAKCLKFVKSSTFKPKIKTFTEDLSFVRRVCIEILTIVIHLLYRFVFWFSQTYFVRFLTNLLHITLQTLSQFTCKATKTGSGAKCVRLTAVCTAPLLTTHLFVFLVLCGAFSCLDVMKLK